MVEGHPLRVAYVMSRFPVITETFILNEMRAMQDAGAAVEVFPILKSDTTVVHPEAMEFVRRAHDHWFVSFAILWANISYLLRQPVAYLSVLTEVLRGTLGSLNFFVGAIGIFPKSVLFARKMRALNIAHVHAHFCNHPAITALIVKRLEGIPYSFTAHGHDIHIDRTMLEHKLLAARFAVTISDYNRKLMLSECPNVDPEHLRVLRCGVDTDLFAPTPQKPKSEAIRMLCIGGFIEVKGHTYLFEACRILRQKLIPFELHLIGAGDGRAALEQQAREGNFADSLIWHGRIPRQEVREAMQSVDLVVQPSVHTARGAREGIPVSLMEGMACGCVPVASDLSGIPELVEDGVSGVLIPPRDPDALAAAIQALASDPSALECMGRASRAKVIAEYDQRKNARALLQMIEPKPPHSVETPSTHTQLSGETR